MKIGRNKHVTLSYELRRNGAEGEVIEKTESDSPLAFVFGAGKMLEMFEQKIEGLLKDEAFNFELLADEAYGQINNDAIVEIPKSIFEVDGVVADDLLKVGNSIPMQDAHGNRMNGLVLELTDENVKMDFNHPLAGDNLYFSGSVLEVREATEDELVACTSGSCGSGGCGDGGDGGCGSGGCGCS